MADDTTRAETIANNVLQPQKASQDGNHVEMPGPLAAIAADKYARAARPTCKQAFRLARVCAGRGGL